MISRRELLKLLGAGAAAAAAPGLAAPAEGRRRNVLFIAVDDLRPELGCYGRELLKTPNMDALAREGVRFRRAYCQMAICGPSRASLMTGLRPDTARVVDNATYFRKTVPDVVTLPQHFRGHGYETVYMGKIYHGGMRDEAKSWSRRATYPRTTYPRAVGGYQLPENKALVRRRQAEVRRKHGGVRPGGLTCGPATECADVPDSAYQDGRTADAAIATMREIKDKPFFLAVGFIRPHLPFVAPKKHWDLYDPAKIDLASNPFAPNGATAIGLHSSFELRTRYGVPKDGRIPDAQARRLIHAYYACASYVDAQIGRVLAELDRLELRQDTVVILWGDHGWHLGDHGIWGKATNYEVATRVPLIVSAPGVAKRGIASNALVELVDMYPTLCELAGLPLPDHLEGASFVPLMARPDRPWKTAAFSQFPCPALREWAALPLSKEMRGTFFGPLIRRVEEKLKAEAPHAYDEELYNRHLMGYSMRTDRYRFTRWVDVRKPDAQPVAVELYDHESDPEENVNLANRPESAGLVRKLTAGMKAGWRGALPGSVGR
jgi:iduronate 2-sulfatase